MDYELTIALKPDLPAERSRRVSSQVSELVEKAGGKVEKTESLGVKTLSYPIQGLTQASFGRFLLNIEPDKLKEIRRELERDDTFLRVFLVKQKVVNSNG